jgi:hypothetical protein
MGKKRKASPYEPTEETERTLYTSFVGAANAVSQLYTQAAQQQRRAASTAARHALVSAQVAAGCPARPPLPHPRPHPLPRRPPQERVICHVLRDNGGGDAISRASLLQFLQQEYEVGGHWPARPLLRAPPCPPRAALTRRPLLRRASTATSRRTPQTSRSRW